MFVPFLLALGFIVAGIVLLTGDSLGTGLILIGIGVLIGSFGGSATLGYGLVRITGPAGLILIVVGVIVRVLVGS